MTPAPTQFYPKNREHLPLFGLCEARVTEPPYRRHGFRRDAGDSETPDANHTILIARPGRVRRALS